MLKHRRGNKIKATASDRIFLGINGVFLTCILFVVIYPLWYTIIASFSEPTAVLTGQVSFWPIGLNLEAYKKVFHYGKVLTGYRNTLVYTFIGTIVNTVLVTTTAYPLSRKDLFGRRFFTIMFAFTMYFSGGLIPTYLVIRGLGLYNSMWALILPFSISMWNVIIMRSFFENSIPPEIHEAAMIDGCMNIQTLIKIVLPLSMPVMSVIILFHAIGYWNAYFNAMIYLSDETKYPLQLVLREILVLSSMNDIMGSADASDSFTNQVKLAESIKYSLVVISSLPALILYPFLQRFFEKGIMVGAVKG